MRDRERNERPADRQSQYIYSLYRLSGDANMLKHSLVLHPGCAFNGQLSLGFNPYCFLLFIQ
jgi:hypothetical protein